MTAFVIKHDWIPITSTASENKNNDSDSVAEDCTILVIGATGVGKSSLIKLFCGPSVKTSSGTDSHTKGATVFTESGDSSRKWLDTQGTDDSKMDETDEIILKKSFKALYDQGLHSCKIIWCVSGDMDRARGVLGKQAQYIIGLGGGDSSVWNSCLIISKYDVLEPDLEDVAGVIAVSKKFCNYGEWTKKNIMGYTCVDGSWELKGSKKKQYEKNIKRKVSPAEMKEDGFLSGEEVKELVIQKLKDLPKYTLTFLNEKCSKCGAEGDHRYVNMNCHSCERKVHAKGTYIFHPGHQTSYHPGHQKEVTTSSSTVKWYHTGESHYSIFGFYSHWTCCQKDHDDQGCKWRYDYDTETEESWTCCSNSIGSAGCKTKYNCCGQENMGGGCKQRYHCCNEFVPASPCSSVCSLCRKEWGTGPGCIAENI